MAEMSTSTQSGGAYNPPSYVDPVNYAAMGNPQEVPTMSVQTFSLPALPYAYNALEPHISSEIMTLHHTKHHQAYVNNLNVAVANYSRAVSASDLPAQIALQSAIKFNGGGHINHSLFWRLLCPPSSAEAKDPEGHAPTLSKELTAAFGSVAGFTSAFSTALMSIQGSGWGWLVKAGPGSGGGLRITTTKDQDPIVGNGDVAVFGVDMWEHAYYLQYKNGKQSYVDAIWKIVNWTAAEERYKGTDKEAADVVYIKKSV